MAVDPPEYPVAIEAELAAANDANISFTLVVLVLGALIIGAELDRKPCWIRLRLDVDCE